MNNKNGSKDLIWYMFGCICNGATSAVILIATTWISGSDDAGIVTFAFTVAQQMLLIGRFEVRSFQITDAKDQFSFSEYYTHRIIFGFIMIMFSFIYVLIRKDGFYKGIVILLLCFYKLTEAISDVFQGNFQKNNMLEKAGKTMVFRECLFMICYVSGLIVSANLVTACLYGTIAAFLWIFFFDFRIENKMQHFAICFSLNKIYVITKACFPIFVGIFANTYLINASKYMIDRFWGDTIQSYYSMIFLPVSIINMLAIIIFFPLMTTLAGMWGRKEYGVTIVVIKKVVLVILCITIIICILGSIIGIPILEEGVEISMRSQKIKEYDPPEPKYEEDQTLQPEQEVVVQEGVKGTTWKTWLVTSKDGKVVNEEYFHTSTYRGKPGIVKRNTTGVVIPVPTDAETSPAVGEGETIPGDPPSSDIVTEETLPEETVPVEDAPSEETSDGHTIIEAPLTDGSVPEFVSPEPSQEAVQLGPGV